MLETADLVAFVSTSDPARAFAFYGGSLGLTLVEESPYALVFRANRTMLRVTVVERVVVAPYTVLGWAVTDIANAIGDLTQRGVVFVRFDGVEQDEAGVWHVPGGARVAWFKDPDGNLLSLTQLETRS
jgi:catechol 2,3-dioxygenase-like lactoylglutathione lyase family enzyme